MDTFEKLLLETSKIDASDLFLNEGAKPTIKIGPNYQTITDVALDSSQIESMVRSQLSDAEWETLNTERSLDIGRELPDIGRFRINIYFQKRSLALVARYVKSEIPTLETLGFPDTLKDLALAERGIILIAGGTGVGKSTTLASLIDYRNRKRQGHIITVEDPIEYIHDHQQSLISQREIGIDTLSYSDALKYALREAPDTVVIGEIREAAVAEQALRLAETGHLCVATVHATSANLAVERFINFFPNATHHLLKELASHLCAVIGQRMAVGIEQPRVMVPEILLNTSQISDCIEKGEFSAIKQAMTDNGEGCITFDESLFEKVKMHQISTEEALRLSDSRINLSLKLQTEGLTSKVANQDTKIRSNSSIFGDDTAEASSFKYDSSESEFSWDPLETKDTTPPFLHVEKSWLSPQINLSSLQYWAVKAHPRCGQINRGLESIISQSLGFTLKEKGFTTNTHLCDAVIHFVFTPEQMISDEVPSDRAEYTIATEATKTQLVLQAKQVETGQVFWRTSAYFVADINCVTFQTFQAAFEELLQDWPSSSLSKKAM